MDIAQEIKNIKKMKERRPALLEKSYFLLKQFKKHPDKYSELIPELKEFIKALEDFK